MRLFKRILKTIGYTLLVLLVFFLVLINIFFKPKTDEKIVELFSETNLYLNIDYQNFKNYRYRIISTKKVLDTSLPNLVFVHGSPGSSMDYKRYLQDEELNKKANLIVYDRVGYGLDNLGDIQSIAFEAELLDALTDNLDISKTILVGYSYGGPIALVSNKKYKKIVLLAPAVYSNVEPMFWFLNFYKWKVTRWILPGMLKAASKEKLQHRENLRNFEQSYYQNPSSIYVVHGDKDWIVPYENSLFIQKQFDTEKFKLVTLKEAGHDLIWTRYEEIKNELIKVIEE